MTLYQGKLISNRQSIMLVNLPILLGVIAAFAGLVTAQEAGTGHIRGRKPCADVCFDPPPPCSQAPALCCCGR